MKIGSFIYQSVLFELPLQLLGLLTKSGNGFLYFRCGCCQISIIFVSTGKLQISLEGILEKVIGNHRGILISNKTSQIFLFGQVLFVAGLKTNYVL